MLGGDLAGGGVDDAGRDGEVAGGGNASAGEVDGRVVVKVVDDGLDRAIGQDQADGASDVAGEDLDAGGDGLGGSLAKGLGHELGLAKEKAVALVVSSSWIPLQPDRQEKRERTGSRRAHVSRP